ncbi:uncharacterized protein K444DRAFT_540299, partial [Hyaloscypha bicolor E]
DSGVRPLRAFLFTSTKPVWIKIRTVSTLLGLPHMAQERGVRPDSSGHWTSILPVMQRAFTTSQCPLYAAHDNGDHPLSLSPGSSSKD